jgi:hypothetical protein
LISGNPASNGKIIGVITGANNGALFQKASGVEWEINASITDEFINLSRADASLQYTAWAMIFYVE